MNELFSDRQLIAVALLACFVCLGAWAWLSEPGKTRTKRTPRFRLFENLEARLPLDAQVGTVTMPYDGYLSAGVYDSSGQLVRTLLSRSPQEAGPVPLVWDGLDHHGLTVTQTGSYTWKALISQVEATDQGGVGDSLFSPTNRIPDTGVLGGGGLVEAQEIVQALATGPDNSIYVQSDWEEGVGLVKYSQSGAVQWGGAAYWGTGLTVGNNLVWAAYRRFDNRNTISREQTSDGLWLDGENSPFIVVNPAPKETFDTGNFTGGLDWTAGSWTTSGPVSVVDIDPGTAVDNRMLLTGSTGIASRPLTMSLATGNHLAFDYKVDGLEAGEKALVQVSPNGSTWTTAFAIESNTTGNTLHQDVLLDPFGLPAAFHVRVISQMSDATDLVYIDNITVNYNPLTADQDRHTKHQDRMRAAVFGMAYDTPGSRLIVGNYRTNSVLVYNASTGAAMPSLTLNSSDAAAPGFTKPLGIALQSSTATSMTIWVAHNDSLVTQYTCNTTTGVWTKGMEITGLSDPGGVAIGGTSNHLFVAQSGDVASGQIRVYSISGGSPVPAGIQTLGSTHQSGPITDTQFHFRVWAAITVDSTGILTVNDFRRTQRFHTEGAQAGQLYQSWQGQWSGTPMDFYGFSTYTDGNGTHSVHKILDGNIEYEVDPEYTGGPRTGWLGDGTWRMTARYYGEGVGVRRTLMDGATPREFLFMVDVASIQTERNVHIYELEGSVWRRVAIVGAEWRGTDRLGFPQGGQYVWTDHNANGLIDGGTLGSGTADGEVNWYIAKDSVPDISSSRPWVDDAGNIWITRADGGVLKIPFGGFTTATDGSGRRNPIYTWLSGTGTPVIPAQADYNSTTVRVAGNGDIYGLGGGPYVTGTGINGTGDHFARYTYSGTGTATRVFQTRSQDLNLVSIAHDDEDPDSQYFYVATGANDQQIIYMYDDDGLLVNKFQYGEASAFTGGWVDYVYGLGAFTHPSTQRTFVYAQDVSHGRSVRHLMENMTSIQRQTNTFTWDAPSVPRGYWPLNSDLADPVGAHVGTFVGGTATYSAGKVANALNLDGTNDNVDISYPGYFEAYTISAWVKADAGAITTRSIIARTDDGQGPLNGYLADQIRINSAGKFEHYTYSSGTGKVVTGTTTVAAGTWYHVAISSSTNGTMRLYVNGVEEGTPQTVAQMWWAGNRFNIGTATAGTVGGSFGYFDGQIDDVHIFESVLTTAQILGMYNQGAGLGGATPTLTVAATDTTVAEASSNDGVFTITRNGTGSAQVVNYILSGTATNGADYQTLTGSVTIANGQSSAIVTVDPIDDSHGDVNETVSLTLAASSGVVASPNKATVKIVDNDLTTFGTNPGWTSFDNTGAGNGNAYGYSATNFAGGATGEIGGTFARNKDESYYADTNLKRKYNLDDYIEASGKLSISGQVGTTEDWFLGHLSSNTTDESIMGIQFKYLTSTTVQFRARMGHPGGGGADGAWVTLPNGVYNFEYHYDPNETLAAPYGGVGGRLTVRIYNGTGYDVTTGSDMNYDRFDPVTFDAFGIGIRGETSTNDPAASIKMYVDDVNYTGKKPPSAVPTVSISASDPVGTETAGGTDNGQFIVSRTGSTAAALTVNYTVNGTATPGAPGTNDYTTLTGSVIIPAGSATAPINVTVNNDTLAEGLTNETVIVTLSPNLAVYAIGASNATVSIIDNEPTVTIVATDPIGTEGVDNGQFTVYRETAAGPVTSGNLTITFAVSGTATPGSAGTNDYNGLGTTVVIPNGASSAPINVTVNNDTLAEGLTNETVIVTIQNNAAYSKGSPFSDAVSIVDNEPTITIVASDPNATEAGDPGQFTVSRNLSTGPATSGNLTVTYAVSGTATSGSDYTSIGTTAVILNGQSTATINVAPLENSTFEPTETVIVNLSAGAYSIGSPNNGTVNITDNDIAGINPSGRWTFNSTLNDSAGSNHGTFTGGSAAYLAGKVGNAIDLDGSNDYVQMMDATDPTAYTVTAWLKPTDVTAVLAVARGSSNVAQGSHMINITSGSKFQHYTYDGANKTVTGTTTVVANTWYHVAITATNSGNMRLYVNGKEEGTATAIGTLWTGGDRWRAGINNTTLALGYFDGLIDDVRVYQQVLTSGQIKEVFADVPPDGRWTFDDTLNDSIGTNHGTFAGGTATYSTGRVGTKAINLDGTDDYAQMMYSTDPTSYTIAAWVKPTDVTSVLAFARGSANLNEASNAIVITSGSKFQHYLWDNSNKTVTGTTTVEANTWYHVAITATNSGLMRLYVNGQEEGTAVTIGSMWTGGDRWRAGISNSTLGLGYFGGQIDDVRVYHQVLSAPEIAQIGGYQTIFATDNFNSGTSSGGTGWSGGWNLGGASSITTSGTPNGSHHLQLTGNTGSATRAVNLSGVTDARLEFNWKASSFESGETAVVEIYDGTSWINVLTIADGQDDDLYHFASVSLSSYTLTSSFQVRIRSLMNASDDFFYIDDMMIVL